MLDHGELVAIGFDDLVKYHGRSSIAGLAHGFKALERSLPLLAGGLPLERYGIWVDSAFAGGRGLEGSRGRRQRAGGQDPPVSAS